MGNHTLTRKEVKQLEKVACKAQEALIRERPLYVEVTRNLTNEARQDAVAVLGYEAASRLSNGDVVRRFLGGQ